MIFYQFFAKIFQIILRAIWVMSVVRANVTSFVVGLIAIFTA